jgi:hypothetical protein
MPVLLNPEFFSFRDDFLGKNAAGGGGAPFVFFVCGLLRRATTNRLMIATVSLGSRTAPNPLLYNAGPSS